MESTLFLTDYYFLMIEGILVLSFFINLNNQNKIINWSWYLYLENNNIKFTVLE
jgi:hypothetical protein